MVAHVFSQFAISSMLTSFPGAESTTDKFEISSTESCGRAPLGFGGHSAVLVGEKVFIFGGHYMSSTGSFVCSNQLFILDLVRMKWSLPIFEGVAPRGRYNHTSAAVGDEVFIFGGRGDGKVLRDMHVLEISRSLKWKRAQRGNAPAARHGHSCDVFAGNLYFFGGHGLDSFFGDLYTFETRTGTWKSLDSAGPAPSPRAFHASTISGSLLIIHGGMQAIPKIEDLKKSGEIIASSFLDDLRVLDIERWTWSRLHTRGPLPSPRYSHTISQVGESLVILGGWQGQRRCIVCNALLPQHTEDCEVRNSEVVGKPGDELVHSLSLGTLEWSPIPTGDEAMRFGHSSVLVSDEELLIFGGWNGAKSIGSLCTLRKN